MSEQIHQEQTSLVVAFDAKRLFNNFTGLGNYSRTLVKNLQSYFPQYKYHLFTPKALKNSETEYFFDTEKFTIHVPTISHPLWRPWSMSADVNELAPDIYHGLSHELPIGINKRQTVTIVTFHDLIFERFPHQFGLWDRQMYKWKYKLAAKKADHIVAISESTKQDLIDIYGVNTEKISVAYQSCNPIFQSVLRGQSTSNTGINVRDYYLYVGSIIERKGLLNIVLAYALLPTPMRKPFVVVGKGDKNYLNKVKDMITYHQLEGFFHFVDGLANDALLSIYDNAYALVLPSIYEGFGIPIIESLYRNKPVITSDISSLPEAGGPGALLVNPYKPIEICEALVRINDPILYLQLSTSGHQYVQKMFNAKTTTSELMSTYKNIIEQKNGDKRY